MKALLYFFFTLIVFAEQQAPTEAAWSVLFKVKEPEPAKIANPDASGASVFAESEGNSASNFVDDAVSAFKAYHDFVQPYATQENFEKIKEGADVAGLAGPLGPFADIIGAAAAAAMGDWPEVAISAIAAVPAFGDSLAMALRVGRKIPVENPNALNAEMIEFISDLNNSTIWVSNAYMDEMDIARIIGKVRYVEGDKRKIVILSGADGSYGGSINTNKSYLKADQNRFGTMENVEVIDITKLDTSDLKKVLEQPDSVIISSLCNGIQCIKGKLQ